MSARVLIVGACYECIYAQHRAGTSRVTCHNVGQKDEPRTMAFSNYARDGKIPAWCPLPKAKGRRR